MEALNALVSQAERGESITIADVGNLLLELSAAAFDARGSGAAGASLATTLREAGERLAAPPVPAELAPNEPPATPEVPAPSHVEELAPPPMARTRAKPTRSTKKPAKKR